MNKKDTKSLNKLLAKARSDEDVLAVMLYGSEARQEQNSTSDIDICLILYPQPPQVKKDAYSHSKTS
jgi:predicted nucleotidyltransferase